MMVVVNEMDTENPFYDPSMQKSKDDGVFCWRVLRMLVRNDIRKFSKMMNKHNGNLEWMANEMFPDHPACKVLALHQHALSTPALI